MSKHVKQHNFLVLSLFLFIAVSPAANSQAVQPDHMASSVERKPVAPKPNIWLTPEEKAWLSEHKTLRIAGPKAFPPFHYFEKDGTVKGIASDYIRFIMERLGVEIEIPRALPWPEVLRKARQKEIDVISCAAKSAEREAYLSFSNPYLTFPLVIISRRDGPFISGIDDLKGIKVSLIKKVSTHEWLKRDKIDAIPHFVNTPLEALKAVSIGLSDAYIGNLAAVSYMIEKNGLANLKIAAPTPYGNYDLYVAVRKDWPQLVSMINKAVGSMVPEEHAAIRNRLLPVRYEHGIRKSDILKWVLGISGISVLIFMVILFWNRTLRRQIGERKKAEEALRERTHDLAERVKELNCLYYISSLREKPDIPLDEIIQNVVNFIPSSWQYPENTCSRIILGDKKYKTPNFKETEWRQANDIFMHGERAGTLEVYYFEEKPEMDEGPFLREERALINAVSERLGRIIERIRVEEQIKSSLKEKEILLQEIHHRVKNNMQIVTSLLRLQAAKIMDEKYVGMFKNATDRIKSMALVHEKLYQSEDFANIDFNDYVKSIANNLIRGYSVTPDKVKLHTEIDDILVELDHAVPCGLIINELISNSLKYAFPKDETGTIRITLCSINHDEIELTVSDDGIGIPGEMDIRETESLGLQLVHILAEDQLEGTLELDRDGGTAFRIRFKEAHNENSGTSISKQLDT